QALADLSGRMTAGRSARLESCLRWGQHLAILWAVSPWRGSDRGFRRSICCTGTHSSDSSSGLGVTMPADTETLQEGDPAPDETEKFLEDWQKRFLALQEE